MRREQLEHIIRAASAITNQRDIVVIGSQAVLGQFPDAPEELLMLELLIGEAHERLELHLVPEPVVAAHIEDLRPDEALDEPEHVGVGATLDLAQVAPLALAKELELVHLRNAVGQELAREIEAAAADDVAIDVEAHPLGNLDAPRVATRIPLWLDVLSLHGRLLVDDLCDGC